MYATGLYCPQKDPERRRHRWDIVDLKIKCVAECERVNERERERKRAGWYHQSSPWVRERNLRARKPYLHVLVNSLRRRSRFIARVCERERREEESFRGKTANRKRYFGLPHRRLFVRVWCMCMICVCVYVLVCVCRKEREKGKKREREIKYQSVNTRIVLE